MGRFRDEGHGYRVVHLTITGPNGNTQEISANVVLVELLSVTAHTASIVLVESSVKYVGRIVGGAGQFTAAPLPPLLPSSPRDAM